MAFYNASNSVGGFNQLLNGLTLFFSSDKEKTLAAVFKKTYLDRFRSDSEFWEINFLKMFLVPRKKYENLC